MSVLHLATPHLARHVIDGPPSRTGDQPIPLVLVPGEILFGNPGKGAVRSEQQVHLFQRALIRFRVEGPDDGDADGVGDACGGPQRSKFSKEGGEMVNRQNMSAPRSF
jgi:hypothetical protein